MDSEELRKIAFSISSEVAGYLRDALDIKGAGDIIKRNAGGDVTRRIDLIAENLLIELIKREGICSLVVSEEIGRKKLCEEPEYIAIVDPLDGSMNYLSKIPFASVSIAFAPYNTPFYNGVLAGAISNIFIRETYSFNKEECFIDNTPLTNYNSTRYSAGNIVVYTGSPDIFRLLHSFMKKYIPWGRLRVLGSAALEICYTGLGRISLFINNTGKLRNVDIVAASKFAEKLGLKVVGIDGEEIDFRLDDIVWIKSIIVGPRDLVNNFIKLASIKGSG